MEPPQPHRTAYLDGQFVEGPNWKPVAPDVLVDLLLQRGGEIHAGLRVVIDDARKFLLDEEEWGHTFEAQHVRRSLDGNWLYVLFADGSEAMFTTGEVVD